jgi:hypothetical protein
MPRPFELFTDAEHADENLSAWYPVRFGLSWILLVASLAAAGTCGSRIVNFFFLTDNFVLGQSRLVCEMPLNNRCVTHYTIRRANGSVSDFVPFGNEFEDEKLLPGMRFEKNRNGFVYRINGLVENWPFLKSQVIVALFGILGLVIWFVTGGVQVWVIWLKLAFKKIDI